MMYSPAVLHYFEQPTYVGEWPVDTPDMVTVQVGSFSLGQMIQLQMTVGNQQQITSAVFKVYGDPFVIACTAFAVDCLQGKTVDEARDITHEAIAQALTIPKAKLHCAVLAEDALTQALDQVTSTTEVYS